MSLDYEIIFSKIINLLIAQLLSLSWEFYCGFRCDQKEILFKMGLEKKCSGVPNGVHVRPKSTNILTTKILVVDMTVKKLHFNSRLFV